MTHIFLTSHILLLFRSPKGWWKIQQNKRNSEKIGNIVLGTLRKIYGLMQMVVL